MNEGCHWKIENGESVFVKKDKWSVK